MNDDMPWVNLTQEEIQELRSKKQELTQYGKEKIRELMNHEEMLEEAARRESAMKAVEKLYDENSNDLKQLADIEKEELNRVTAAERYFKKVEESLERRSIQEAIGKIGEYTNVLSNTKSSKLILKLNAKHRENLTLVSKTYLEEYEKQYGEIPEYEKLMFMESSYFIPGDGHTTCLLITQALPCHGDYDSSNLSITTREYRAVREFYEEFGASSLYNLSFHSRDSFFEQYCEMIPYTLTKLKDKPCFLNFKTKLHYNFP